MYISVCHCIACLFAYVCHTLHRSVVTPLRQVIERRGTPSEDVWKDVSSLPNFLEFTPHPKLDQDTDSFPAARDDRDMAMDPVLVSIFLAVFTCYGLISAVQLLPTSVAFVLCSQVFAWGLKMKLESSKGSRNNDIISQLSRIALGQQIDGRPLTID
eukprot:Skav224667  [mRNA]  locus=scaffold3549:81004:93591:+ [translate_table: standard]